MLERIKRVIPKRVFKFLQPIYHFILSLTAAIVFRFPSGRLIVIGVTGTAGKTSTVYLIAKMLEQAGYKTGFTSTTIFSDGDKEWLNDKKMTMPGRFFIQSTLRKMLKNKCRYAIIETTSEGIKQSRHRFINYDILVFTGLYPEHIEAHGSFEKYKKTKGRLFDYLRNCPTKYVNDQKEICYPKSELEKTDLRRVNKTSIINGDDEQVEYFLNFWSEAKIVFSTQDTNLEVFKKMMTSEMIVQDFRVVRGQNIKATAQGTEINIDDQLIRLKLLGSFNALNALAVYSVGLDQGIDSKIIKNSLEKVKSLAGKLEKIEVGQDFIAIVDYSFEPRALEKLYKTINLLPHNKIIHLLGSTGGGRDKERRPALGKIAGVQADFVVVTNEDPYNEEPAVIIDEVAIGAEKAGKELNKNLFKILDRREAIKKALSLAQPNDLVLFTGKGAEQYICGPHESKIPWDDRKVVREEIIKLKSIE